MNSKEALQHLVANNFNEMICTYPAQPAYNGHTDKDMIKIIENDLELLDLLLKDIRVEYCGNQEEYIINSCYNKKSKVYQLLEKHFK